MCQTDTEYFNKYHHPIHRITQWHENNTYVIRITMQMTVVVTENAYAENTGWIVWVHIIIYSWKRHDGHGHRTQPSRRGSEKSARCPLKAPQKPGEITFFPLFLPFSTPTRIHTRNILLYTGCSAAIVPYPSHRTRYENNNIWNPAEQTLRPQTL